MGRPVIYLPGKRADYRKDVRPVNWGSGVFLRGNNSADRNVEMGQKRPFRPHWPMSALTPIATAIATCRPVAKCSAARSLFDQLVGDGEFGGCRPEAPHYKLFT